MVWEANYILYSTTGFTNHLLTGLISLDVSACVVIKLRVVAAAAVVAFVTTFCIHTLLWIENKLKCNKTVTSAVLPPFLSNVRNIFFNSKHPVVVSWSDVVGLVAKP
jgi:hypothetical protein